MASAPQARDAIFHGPTAGVIIGILFGLTFIGYGVWFYRWGKQVQAMTPEERRTHRWGQGLMGFSGVGASLRNPRYAFLQAYFMIVLGSVALVALPVLSLTGH